MKWAYLSHYYNDSTPGYGGKQDFKIMPTKCIANGDTCNQIQFTMSNHVGTHIDLPAHFFGNGKIIKDFSPEEWLFENVVVVEVDLKNNELIQSNHLPKLSENVECLLLKTSFESKRTRSDYWQENPGLTKELGDFLKIQYKKLRVIGFDFISATAYQHREEGKLAHRAFLGNENGPAILIMEDMRLVDVSSKTKINLLIVSPLLIENADGAPVTVMAKIENSF